MKILLGNSRRLDQTRVLSGFPNSKEFDFSRSNELKCLKQFQIEHMSETYSLPLRQRTHQHVHMGIPSRPSCSNKYLCPTRSGIGSDIMEKIEKHDSKIFQGMAEREFKKFTPDMIAAAGVSRYFLFLRFLAGGGGVHRGGVWAKVTTTDLETASLVIQPHS